MKLNKKGYMLVEIVIAAVLAFSISFYLLNLTYKFKNKNEDLFQAYLYTKDKTLATKNIMQDLDKGEVMNVEVNNESEYKEFTFNLRIHGTTDLYRRRLAITKENGKTIIQYGLVKCISIGDGLETKEIFDYDDLSYYKKEIAPTFIIGDLEYEANKDAGAITFKIPIKSIYSDVDYSIKLCADYFEPNLMKELFVESTSTEYYKNDLYREKIISSYFVDYIDVTNAEQYWDVSKAEDGTIIAWIENNETEGFYNLYIGSDSLIYAESLKYFFSNMLNLTNVSFDTLNTSMTTNMASMFASSKANDEIYMSLTSLDLSSFDTSNVTSMQSMFYGCGNLTNLDVSDFDTSNVTTMRTMFYNCENLTTLDVSNFDTSNVTNMQSMFRYCRNLTSLDVSNFDTSKVTDMKFMFAVCGGLVSLDVSNFDTSKVTDMNGMFSDCENLTTLDVSGFNTSKVTDMSGMFYDCYNLSATITITNQNTTTCNKMFEDAATAEGTKIIINYTSETSALVDAMIATKSSNSNVVKGSLVE